MKAKLKTYNDKLKVFLKVMLKAIPFMRNLSAESIEEVTYHLKQKYYDPNEVIFRPGDPVNQIYLVTRGEVNLIVNIENHDFIVHNLYQGCYIGGYKIFGDSVYNITARAVSSVTLHYINKDSISLLQNSLSDFKAEIEIAKNYFEFNKRTVVGFGLFRDERGNVTPGEIFKMSAVKIFQLNREFKEVGI
jgi:signal-transduction protein with cAMP-binding, CBS, and nucleotidyltransferase domain